MGDEGLITFDELRAKLAALQETREIAERELAALPGRKDQMEHDKDALLEHYEAITPDALNALIPEERHEFYKVLRLKVTVSIDGTLEVTGRFLEGAMFCLSTPTQRW